MKPAKSWICYFSPTGTSRRVAEAVGRGLNCAQTIVCDATHDAVSVAAERGDAAVFAVPVYGGHAAPLALRRLDAVRGDGTPAVVVVLYGNRAYEHAACELADFVAARGFVPVAAAAFVGEHSYSTARWPIAAGRPDGDDCAEAEAFGRVVAAKLAAGGVFHFLEFLAPDLERSKPTSSHAEPPPRGARGRFPAVDGETDRPVAGLTSPGARWP